MNHKTVKRARMRLKENVEYQLFDKDGNAKKLFAMNGLGNFLLANFRKFIKNPIDAHTGQVKKGFLNSLAAYGVMIPLLTGNYTTHLQVSNLVTTAGKALVAGRINGSGAPAAADYIAVGTGTTAANVADTTLETETAASGLTRAQGTVSLVTTDTTNDTAQVLKSFSVSGTVAVTESGVLNASSNGTLLCRQVFSAINVVSGDTLQITWKIDVD